jgi:hypothetical protein
VRVVAYGPDSHRHLVVLTRPGYYAPRTTQIASFSASTDAGVR